MTWIATIFVVSGCLFRLTDTLWESCEHDRNCARRSLYSLGLSFSPILEAEECKDNRCQCKKADYGSNGAITCRPKISYDCSFTSDEGCAVSQECSYGSCVCKNSSLFKVDDMCLPRTFVKLWEKCYVDKKAEMIFACDNMRNKTNCQNSKCICFRDYYYNKTSSSCKSKKDYIKMHGLESYTALPGGYCVDSSDCIEGLICHKNFTCSCPSECPFEKKRQICDCGEVEYQYPKSVIYVGIFFGLVFVGCWSCIIRNKARKLIEKRDRTYTIQQQSPTLPQSISTVSDEPLSTGEIPLQSPSQLGPENATQTPASDPISKGDEPPPYSSLKPPSYDDIKPTAPLAQPDLNIQTSPSLMPTAPRFS